MANKDAYIESIYNGIGGKEQTKVDLSRFSSLIQSNPEYRKAIYDHIGSDKIGTEYSEFDSFISQPVKKKDLSESSVSSSESLVSESGSISRNEPLPVASAESNLDLKYAEDQSIDPSIGGGENLKEIELDKIRQQDQKNKYENNDYISKQERQRLVDAGANPEDVFVEKKFMGQGVPGVYDEINTQNILGLNTEKLDSLRINAYKSIAKDFLSKDMLSEYELLQDIELSEQKLMQNPDPQLQSEIQNKKKILQDLIGKRDQKIDQQIAAEQENINFYNNILSGQTEAYSTSKEYAQKAIESHLQRIKELENAKKPYIQKLSEARDFAQQQIDAEPSKYAGLSPEDALKRYVLEIYDRHKTAREGIKKEIEDDGYLWSALTGKIEWGPLGQFGTNLKRLGVISETDSEKIARETSNELQVLAPIALLNINPNLKDDWAWERFAEQLPGSFANFNDRFNTEQEKAETITKALQATGADVSKVDQEVLKYQTRERTLKDSDFWADMGATMTPIALELAGTSSGVGLLKTVPRVSRFYTGLEKALQLSKSKYINKMLFEGVDEGLKYELAGQIFKENHDELNFATGFASGVLGKPVKSITKKLNTKSAEILENSILQKTVDSIAGGVGETAEEYLQEIAQSANSILESGNVDKFMEELNIKFGTLDKNVQFALSTFIAGSVMRFSSKAGEAYLALSTDAAKDFTPKQKAQFKEAVQQLNKETRVADVYSIDRETAEETKQNLVEAKNDGEITDVQLEEMGASLDAMAEINEQMDPDISFEERKEVVPLMTMRQMEVEKQKSLKGSYLNDSKARVEAIDSKIEKVRQDLKKEKPVLEEIKPEEKVVEATKTENITVPVEQESVIEQESLTIDQKKQNRIAQLKSDYNKLSTAKKNTKKGSAIRSELTQLASQLDFRTEIDPVSKKIEVYNKKNKRVTTIKSKPVQFDITKEKIDYALGEINKGVFIGYDFNDKKQISPRVELDDVTKDEIKKGLQAIEKGNYKTVPAQRVINALYEQKSKGGYVFMEGTGGKTYRTFVPFENMIDDNNEFESLSPEQQTELAREFDQFYANLSEDQKKDLLEEYQRAEQEITKRQNEEFIREGQGQIDVQDQKGTTEADQSTGSEQSKQKASQINKETEELLNSLEEEDVVVENNALGLKFPNIKGKDVSKFVKRYFTKEGFLTSSGFDAMVVRDNNVNKSMNLASQTARDLRTEGNKYIKDNKLDKKSKEKFIRDMDAYLKGVNKDLPENIKSILNKMRSQVDGLTNAMLRMGLVNGELAQTLKDNLGVYLTRQYRIHNQKNWIKKIPIDVRNKAVEWAVKNYQFIPEMDVNLFQQDPYEAASNYIDDLIATESKSGSVLVREEKLSSQDLSILKKRKDIPAPIRALFGEFLDPNINYVNTITKMVSLIENRKLANKLLEIGLSNGLVSDKPFKNSIRLKKDISTSLQPLTGKHIDQDFLKALEDFGRDQSTNSKLLKTWLYFNSTVKIGKTLFSHATHARNITSNFLVLLSHGAFNPKDAIQSLKVLSNQDPDKRISIDGIETTTRNYYNKLIELGVLHDTVSLGTVKDLINDAFDTDGNFDDQSFINSPVFRSARNFKNKVADIYRAEDDFFKLVVFEKTKREYSKSLYGKNPDQLNEKDYNDLINRVAKIIPDTMFTYSRIPKAIKLLRRMPLFGTFPSFTWESSRTLFNQIKLAYQEINDPKLRNIGIKRMVTILAAQAAPAAMIAILRNYISGAVQGGQEDDDLKTMLAPWNKQHQIFAVKTGKGKYYSTDFTQQDAYGSWKIPFIAIQDSNEGFMKNLSQGLIESLTPFLGTEIGTQIIEDLRANKKSGSDAPIYIEGDWDSVVSDGLSYALKQAQPGTIYSLDRLYNAYKDPEKNFNYELLAQFGVRVSEVDVEKAVKFHAYDIRDEMNQISSAYNKEIKGKSKEEKDEIYKRYNEKYLKAEEKIQQEIAVLRRMGFNDREILGMLSQGNIGKTRINQALKRKTLGLEKK